MVYRPMRTMGTFGKVVLDRMGTKDWGNISPVTKPVLPPPTGRVSTGRPYVEMPLSQPPSSSQYGRAGGEYGTISPFLPAQRLQPPQIEGTEFSSLQGKGGGYGTISPFLLEKERLEREKLIRQRAAERFMMQEEEQKRRDSGYNWKPAFMR
ncbi:MAG: hypothetical protein QME51_03940 [Planctomycetota bacterium]|nr:hypothetical protein [Planctomycetota bacterium]